jgi:hypothetical protein
LAISLYGEGGLHDLRGELFSNAGKAETYGDTLRNGNHYPTAGLGPVANYMGFSVGWLVHMVSRARSAADDYRTKM